MCITGHSERTLTGCPVFSRSALLPHLSTCPSPALIPHSPHLSASPRLSAALGELWQRWPPALRLSGFQSLLSPHVILSNRPGPTRRHARRRPAAAFPRSRSARHAAPSPPGRRRLGTSGRAKLAPKLHLARVAHVQGYIWEEAGWAACRSLPDALWGAVDTDDSGFIESSVNGSSAKCASRNLQRHPRCWRRNAHSPSRWHYWWVGLLSSICGRRYVRAWDHDMDLGMHCLRRCTYSIACSVANRVDFRFSVKCYEMFVPTTVPS